MPVKSNIDIGGARIGFRNFSGVAGRFNAEGLRNFCVFLEHDIATVLKEDGWNVKWLKPRDEDELPQAYLQVSVAFGKYPPKIFMLTSRGKTRLDEEDVKMLDWAEIESVDLTIRPYNWEKGRDSGVKAYVKEMFVKIVESEFEKKYIDVPDYAGSATNRHEPD